MTASTPEGVDVLSVLDADLRYTTQRLARHRRKADLCATRKGERQPGADDHCDWVEYVRDSKREVRAATEALMEAVRSARREIDTVLHVERDLDFGSVRKLGKASAELRAALSRMGPQR